VTAESDDWSDDEEYAKLCVPISEDADPSTLLTTQQQPASSDDNAETTDEAVPR
jgi:hypothetical protein